MKKLGVMLCALVLTVMLCVLATTPTANVSAANVSNEMHETFLPESIAKGFKYERKIESKVSIDEDFDGSTVMVIVDRYFSGINKRHSANFFGDIKIAGIEDLTAVPDSWLVSKESMATKEDLSVLSADAKSKFDEENFEQVLQITLPQNSKENVIKTIEKLQRIDGIKYAGPNRIRQIERTPDDPQYTLPATATTGQWGHEKINVRSAWDITTGSHNVRVGIISCSFASSK